MCSKYDNHYGLHIHLMSLWGEMLCLWFVCKGECCKMGGVGVVALGWPTFVVVIGKGTEVAALQINPHVLKRYHKHVWPQSSWSTLFVGTVPSHGSMLPSHIKLWHLLLYMLCQQLLSQNALERSCWILNTFVAISNSFSSYFSFHMRSNIACMNCEANSIV